MWDIFNYHHLASHLNTEYIHQVWLSFSLSVIVYTSCKNVHYPKVMAPDLHCSVSPFTQEVVLKKKEWKLLAIIRNATTIDQIKFKALVHLFEVTMNSLHEDSLIFKNYFLEYNDLEVNPEWYVT